MLRIRPGEILDVFTEDAFGGKIRTSTDLPSRSIVYPFINPQTGPFYVEGAEVGDTLAIHLIDVQPARDWGVSTTVPLFGSLTGTKFTATLQEPLPEKTWVYSVDRPPARSGTRPSTPISGLLFRSGHSMEPSAWRRPPGRRATCWCRKRLAGTWTHRTPGLAPPSTWVSTSRARCSASGMATTRWARAKSAGWRSKAP